MEIPKKKVTNQSTDFLVTFICFLRGLRKGRSHSIDYHALTNQTSADLLFFQGVCGATKMNVLTVTLLQMGHPQAHR